MHRLSLLVPLAVAGCSFDGPGAGPAPGTDAATAVDAPDAPCLQRWRAGTPAFGMPVRLDTLATGDAEEDPWLTPDEQRIVFVRVASNGDGDLYTATRDEATAAFPTPRILSSLSGGDDEGKATFLADLSRVFITADTGSDSNVWIGAATGGIEDPWTWDNQSIIVAVNDSGEDELDPWISADGLALYWSNTFDSAQPTRIEMATRLDLQSAFGEPAVVMASESHEFDPALTADQLVMVFGSSRPATPSGPSDLWFATRAAKTDPFGTPQRVPGLESSGNESDPWLSADGCRVYFSSSREGDTDLFFATMQL